MGSAVFVPHVKPRFGHIDFGVIQHRMVGVQGARNFKFYTGFGKSACKDHRLAILAEYAEQASHEDGHQEDHKNVRAAHGIRISAG